MAALLNYPSQRVAIGRRFSARKCRRQHVMMIIKGNISTVKQDNKGKPRLNITRPYTGVAGALCDAAENFISSYIDPPVPHPRSDPKIQLADNFAPVSEEVPPRACTEVTGEIPDCLDGGVYIRNGANPLYKPVGGYHFFDGHGMLHAVKFIRGVPYYSCRYTKTARYELEVAAGRSLYPNMLGDVHGVPGLARMGLFAMRAALGVLDVKKGIGTANAGLVYHNGVLLAMSEDDMPYAVKIYENGDLETLGRYGFLGDNKLERPMTAHPKVDPETGEMLSYSYSVMSKPYLKFFTISADGVKSPDMPISLPEPVLLHDFVVTKNFVVFPENQMVFRIQDLLLKRKSALVCDENKVPRFGVLSRSAKDSSEMKWFDVPGFTAFHFLNGWEEDGGKKIVILASAMRPISGTFDDPASLRNVASEIHFDLTTGKATEKRVSSAVLDAGQVNNRFTGRKTRYAYLSIYGPWPKYSGIAKLDLSAPRMRDDSLAASISEAVLEQDPAVAGWRKFGPSRFGSEPFFVPRTDSNREEDEDDGFVLSFVHDELTGVSELLIMDARSPKLETVASIKLPSRVPYGFHGLFVSKEQTFAVGYVQRLSFFGSNPPSCPAWRDRHVIFAAECTNQLLEFIIVDPCMPLAIDFELGDSSQQHVHTRH